LSSDRLGPCRRRRCARRPPTRSRSRWSPPLLLRFQNRLSPLPSSATTASGLRLRARAPIYTAPQGAPARLGHPRPPSPTPTGGARGQTHRVGRRTPCRTEHIGLVANARTRSHRRSVGPPVIDWDLGVLDVAWASPDWLYCVGSLVWGQWWLPCFTLWNIKYLKIRIKIN
jgi:hypothetical protein